MVIDGDIRTTGRYAWIFVDICGYLWLFVDICVDICGYSIHAQSYLHAGRPPVVRLDVPGTSLARTLIAFKSILIARMIIAW
jgi:hypothetical protein